MLKEAENGEFDREEFDRWADLPDMEKAKEQLDRIEAYLATIAEAVSDIADTDQEKRLRHSQLGTVQTLLATVGLDLRVCTAAFERLEQAVREQGEG